MSRRRKAVAAQGEHLKSDLPETHQLAGLFEEIIERCNVLRFGTTLTRKDEPDVEIPSFEELLKLAAAARRDGYPTSRSESGGAIVKVGDDGVVTIVTREATGPRVSDPTGETATGDRIVDPIKIHLQSCIRGLTGALGDLRMATTAQQRATQYAEVGPGEPRCTSCERIGEWTDVYRGERCQWCHKFWLLWRVEVPIDILRAHHAGRKITTQMVQEALKPPKRLKAKAGRR